MGGWLSGPACGTGTCCNVVADVALSILKFFMKLKKIGLNFIFKVIQLYFLITVPQAFEQGLTWNLALIFFIFYLIGFILYPKIAQILHAR